MILAFLLTFSFYYVVLSEYGSLDIIVTVTVAWKSQTLLINALNQRINKEQDVTQGQF